jgi:hypothetical protein
MLTKKPAALALALSSTLIQHAVAAPVTDPNDPRNWQGATVGTFAGLYFGSDTLANRQQVIDKGLLDDGLFSFAGATAATLIKADGLLGTGTSLDTTGTGSFAYTSGGDPFVAGNSIDTKWIQNSAVVGNTIFDLGAPSTKAAVFPTIDHGPLPQESIESTVYLSNDKVVWTEAVVEKVWLEGWEANLGILWDGFVYAVGTGTGDTFRYASIINGGPGALQHDGDDEINGILGLDSDFTPTPRSGVPDGGSTALLVGLGIASLAAVSRKR